jgi:hypothetical protein
MAPHLRTDPCRTVSIVASIFHWHVPDQFHFLFQLLCQRNCRKEDFHVEPEHRSFDRRHFLEYGIQNGDPGLKGTIQYAYYMHYINYINYAYYAYYTHYIYYLQIRLELGIADHVWQEKRTLIAETVEKLGDQFRPDMRTGWLSYLRRAYPEQVAQGAGPAVGEDVLVLPD